MAMQFLPFKIEKLGKYPMKLFLLTGRTSSDTYIVLPTQNAKLQKDLVFKTLCNPVHDYEINLMTLTTLVNAINVQFRFYPLYKNKLINF